MRPIKITVSGVCGSGKTVLAYRILELLRADGWQIDSVPIELVGVDEIRQQATRDPQQTSAVRSFLKPMLDIKITEQSVRRGIEDDA